jgi:hypothetical protein
MSSRLVCAAQGEQRPRVTVPQYAGAAAGRGGATDAGVRVDAGETWRPSQRLPVPGQDVCARWRCEAASGVRASERVLERHVLAQRVEEALGNGEVSQQQRVALARARDGRERNETSDSVSHLHAGRSTRSDCQRTLGPPKRMMSGLSARCTKPLPCSRSRSEICAHKHTHARTHARTHRASRHARKRPRVRHVPECRRAAGRRVVSSRAAVRRTAPPRWARNDPRM